MHLILQLRKLGRALAVFGQLAETRMKSWSTVSKLEIPDLLWFNVKEGIQRLGEIGMLE